MEKEIVASENNSSLTPRVVYEDRHVVVVEKPAGLLSHGDTADELSVAKWFRENYPRSANVGGDSVRAGLAHRLDIETSGLLVLARSNPALIALQGLFRARLVSKKYQSLVYGIVGDDRGIIDRPIGKGKGDLFLRTSGSGRSGTLRDALTYYRVMERFSKADISFVEWYPKTGRTHQIRVHAKAIGHPLLCDRLYAPGRPCLYGMGRVALHATGISFTLFDQEYSFESPLPLDMTQALVHLRSL